MSIVDQIAASAFWQFSLEVYARPQVADLCLALQDEHDFNVNALLFCLWSAQSSHRALDQSEIGEILARITPLDENLVKPLRDARRWLRACLDQATDPDAAAELAKLYAALKAVELKAERQVQSALVDPARPVCVQNRTAPLAAAHASFENYRLAIAAPQAAAALLSQLVVTALAPEAEPGISQP